jgi:hypothetical protein
MKPSIVHVIQLLLVESYLKLINSRSDKYDKSEKSEKFTICAFRNRPAHCSYMACLLVELCLCLCFVFVRVILNSNACL